MICNFKIENGQFNVIKEYHVIDLNSIYYSIRFYRDPFKPNQTKEGFFSPKENINGGWSYGPGTVIWIFDISKEEYWVNLNLFEDHHTKDLNKIEGERFIEVSNLIRFSFWYKRQKKINDILCTNIEIVDS